MVLAAKGNDAADGHATSWTSISDAYDASTSSRRNAAWNDATRNDYASCDNASTLDSIKYASSFAYRRAAYVFLNTIYSTYKIHLSIKILNFFVNSIQFLVVQ